MNKKEVLEIRKQFTPENCTITRICGCYVDGEKNKKTELKEAFLSLSEEEMFKYILKVSKKDKMQLTEEEVQLILEGEFEYGKSIGIYREEE